MAIHHHNHRLRLPANPAAAALLLAALLAAGGCKAPLNVSALKNLGGSRPEDLANIDQTRGPLERILQMSGRGRADDAPASHRPAAGAAEYEEALAIYKRGEYKQAEKDFKHIAKRYKDTQLEEDALFMLAEARFEQKRYSWAQDGYDELLKKYPSTRYLDTTTKRLFTIARTWLRFPDVVTSGDIQQVDFEDRKKAAPPKADDAGKRFELTRAVPILPNFVDRTRPVFDTEGRALQALKSIWLNDPTGPLADDALMLTASQYLRKGDYIEANRVYAILRQEYPKSPHLENAFVLGSHVQLMSYDGPGYDGKALEDAERLKESTLKLFPETRDRDRILRDLRQIEEEKARRDWESAVYWDKKNKPRSVAVYCRQVIENYPESTYAQRARQKLEELRQQAAAGDRSIAAALVDRLPDLPSLSNPLARRNDAPDDRGAQRNEAADVDDVTIIDEEPKGLGQRLLERVPRMPRLLRPPSGDDEPFSE